MPRPKLSPIGDTKRATAKQISALQTKYGFKLPKAYQAFLLETNGGEPDPMFFAYKDKANMADRGAIDVFLHLGSGDWSLDEFIDIYVVNKSVPKGYLPMAFDQFGDLICLVLEGVEAGRIKWCPTDQGLLVFGKDGYPEVGVTHEVADSLEEFLDSFVSEE